MQNELYFLLRRKLPDRELFFTYRNITNPVSTRPFSCLRHFLEIVCKAHTETQSHRDSLVTQSTEKASP